MEFPERVWAFLPLPVHKMMCKEVAAMRCGSGGRVYTTSYPSLGGKVLRIVGITLIVTGVILIVLCVPLWAWLALVGAALIVIGVLLLK